MTKPHVPTWLKYIGGIGALWLAYQVTTVAVFDPHIRTVTRDEVPKAIATIVDDAVIKASRPHLETARMQHEVITNRIATDEVQIAELKKQLDNVYSVLNAQIQNNRDEREKFQKALMDRDADQMRAIGVLDRKVTDLIKYVLEHNATAKKGDS